MQPQKNKWSLGSYSLFALRCFLVMCGMPKDNWLSAADSFLHLMHVRLQKKSKQARCQKGVVGMGSQLMHAVRTDASSSSRSGANASWRLVSGKPGDHLSIWNLLQSVFHGPSSMEFQAQLDEPLYEPTNRLLIKKGEAVIAHLRLSPRTMHFGGLEVPVAHFMDLATTAEYQGLGLATILLAAGERQARTEKATLALVRTSAPELFARQGWAECGQHLFSAASPRELLAHLQQATVARTFWEALRLSSELPPRGALVTDPTHEVPLLVRPMRRMELPAVRALYEQQSKPSFGNTVRSEAYWDWLMSRGGFERALVAVVPAHSGKGNAPSATLRGNKTPGEIVCGAAFVRRSRIVELLIREDFPAARTQLLTHLAADWLERGWGSLRLDAPPSDPGHALLQKSGGTLVARPEFQGEVFMAKLLSPLNFLREQTALFSQRAKAANLRQGLEIGLVPHPFGSFRTEANSTPTPADSTNPKTATADQQTIPADNQQPTKGRHWRIVVTRRGVRIEQGKMPRNQLHLCYRDLAPLLLGHWNVAERCATGDLRPTSPEVQLAAEALFPELPLWRPALDDLVA